MFNLKNFALLSVALFCILLGFNVLSANADPFSVVGAIAVIGMIAFLWGLGIWNGNGGFGSGLTVVIFLAALTMTGGDLITKVTQKQTPIAIFTIQQNNTYVEAPENIKDPALKGFLTKKIGLENGWVKNTLVGGYLFFVWVFALTMYIEIRANKEGAVIIALPLEFTTFVVGCFVCAIALAPGTAPDSKTALAENEAFWYGAGGTLVWSLILTAWSKIYKYGSQTAGQIGGVAPLIFMVLAVPVFSLCNLFDLQFFTEVAKAEAMTTTAITNQRWIELQYLGKWFGIFAPPTISFTLELMRFLFYPLLKKVGIYD